MKSSERLRSQAPTSTNGTSTTERGGRGQRTERVELAGPPGGHDQDIDRDTADRRVERDARCCVAAPRLDPIDDEDQPDSRAEQEAVVPGYRRQPDQQPCRDVRLGVALEPAGRQPQ